MSLTTDKQTLDTQINRYMTLLSNLADPPAGYINSLDYMRGLVQTAVNRKEFNSVAQTWAAIKPTDHRSANYIETGVLSEDNPAGAELKSLINLTWQIMALRGGGTSGNWAHTSKKRQGKHGGSDTGGGFDRLRLKKGTTSRKDVVTISKRFRKARDKREARAKGAAPKPKPEPEPKQRTHAEIKTPPKFKTTKEAEAWATENLISDKAKEEREQTLARIAKLEKEQGVKYKPPPALVSFRGLKPDAANEINETVTEMLNDADMPKLSSVTAKGMRKETWGAQMSQFGNLNVNTKEAKDKAMVEAAFLRSQKEYSQEAKDLYQQVSKGDMSKLSARERRLLQSKQIKEHFKYDRFTVAREDNPYKSLIEHEIGHHIDFQAHSRIPDWREKSTAAIQTMATPEFKYKLSEYPFSMGTYVGGHTRAEIFAESVAAYRKGERKGTLSPEMINLLDEVFS